MVDIGRKIDEYAQKYNTQLRAQENKTGHRINKYDVAQYMLSQGVLNSADLNNWLKTSEGLKNKNESEQLKKMPVWQAAQAFHGGTYLDSVSEFSIGSIMGFEKTQTGQIKATKSHQKFKTPKQQLEEQKLKQHLDSLPEVKGNPIEMTKKIDAQAEAEKIQDMTYDECKNYIMGKFLDAKDKNDKMGMLDAINEFYSYECEFLDKKFGITNAKDFLKNKSGLNRLVDYIDKAIDDGNDGNISAGERAWEIVKGVGDTLDSFIGTQGFTMAVGLGGATKAAQAIPKAGPLVGGAIQAYFGIEGSQLVFEGTKEIIEADTKEEIRQGASQSSMGAIMVGGATRSAKNGLKKDVKIDKKASEIAEYKVELKDIDSNAAPDVSGAATNYTYKVKINGQIIKVVSKKQMTQQELTNFVKNNYNKPQKTGIKDTRTFKSEKMKAEFDNMQDKILRSRLLDIDQRLSEDLPPNSTGYKTADSILDNIIKTKDYKEIEKLELYLDAIYELSGKQEKIMDIAGVNSKQIRMERSSKYSLSHYAKNVDNTSIQTWNDQINDGKITTRINRGKQSFKGDLKFNSRWESAIKFMKKYPNSEISERFYNDYLKMISKNQPEMATRLNNINADLGVKVILPSAYNIKQANLTLDYIQKEFGMWKKASNGKAKLPPTIEFNTAHADFHFMEATKGKYYTAAAISQADFNGALIFPEMTPEMIKNIRHETTHTNDLKLGNNIPEKYNLDEIMPKKQIIQNGKTYTVPDTENCKYAREFRKAGLDERSIQYAHLNTKEFIAVASEGNMSAYSPEFKQVLIDFGMPEWELNLAPNE